MHKFKIVPPEILPVREVLLPAAIVHTLDNGLQVVEVHAAGQDILRVEIVFRSGRPYEQKAAVASSVDRLLTEGAGGKSAAELAEIVDFYGGSIYSRVNLDVSSLVLNTLPRYAAELIPLLADMVWMPHFEPRELALFVEQNIQRLAVDLSKNDTLAYRRMTETLFGAQHWYGYNTMPEHYLALSVEDLAQHHARTFHPNNAFMLLSGHTHPSHIGWLNQHFGGRSLGPKVTPEPEKTPSTAPKLQKEHLNVPESSQISLWLGRKLFDRNHPDYAGLYVLNTILGGYFGSRLMVNIREKRGYTYNISSAIDNMWRDGMWYISAEVNRKSLSKVLHEIGLECSRLQTELVPEAELEMVRNYLLGSFLSMVDGPFAVADVYKTLRIDEAEMNHFAHLVDSTREIGAEELKRLAQTYLQLADFVQVTAG